MDEHDSSVTSDSAAAATPPTAGGRAEISATPIASPWGRLIWLLLLLLAAVWLWPADAPPQPEPLAAEWWLPTTTAAYIEVRDVRELSTAMQQSPHWKKGNGREATAAIHAALLQRLGIALGGKNAADVAWFTKRVTGLGLAIVPRTAATFGYALFLKMPDPAAGVAALKGDLAFALTASKLRGADIYQVSLPRGTVYLRVLFDGILITTQKDLLGEIITAVEVMTGGETFARSTFAAAQKIREKFAPPKGTRLVWAAGDVAILRTGFPPLDWFCQERLGVGSRPGFSRLQGTTVAGVPHLLVTVDCEKLPAALRVKEPLAAAQLPTWLQAGDAFRQSDAPLMVSATADAAHRVHLQIGYPQAVVSPPGAPASAPIASTQPRGWLMMLVGWLWWAVKWGVGIGGGLIALLIGVILALSVFVQARDWWLGDEVPPMNAASATAPRTEAQPQNHAASDVRERSTPSLETIERAAGGAVGLSESEIIPRDE